MKTKSAESPHRRLLKLPAEFEDAIRETTESLGADWSSPTSLAKDVLRLSDHYVANPLAATPWSERWAQIASLTYYFPLNLARNLSVAREGSRLGFFEGLDTLVDFGSGTGSALFAFTSEERKGHFARCYALDVSRDALALARKLATRAGHEPATQMQVDGADQRPRLEADPSRSLIVSSYALTELEALPRWWLDFEAIAILEPSTREDGRRLMERRRELIEAGYTLWAPCTHQSDCPLLINSERDWCHDRIHWESSAWMTEMERTLPMKNRTLTFSYLLARKKLAPPSTLSDCARLVGDSLIEKGKSRQALCRGPEREFLAWFPQRMKKEESIALERGNLVRLKGELEKKSSEVRLPNPEAIEELSPTESIP